MSYTAFKTSVAVPRVPNTKITSVGAFGEYLFIGTNDGHILRYKQHQNPDNHAVSYELDVKKGLSYGRKPVTDIHVVVGDDDDDNSGGVVGSGGERKINPLVGRDFLGRKTGVFSTTRSAAAVPSGGGVSRRMPSGWIFALCDGHVCLLDIDEFELIPRLPLPRNLKTLAAECHRNKLRVFIAAKKRIALFECELLGGGAVGDDGGVTPEAVRKNVSLPASWKNVKELTLPTPPKRMAWCGHLSNMLCIGFKTGYSLLAVASGQIINLSSLNKTENKPMIHVMPMPNTEMLLRLETMGLFLDFFGEPTRSNIVWNQAPAAVGICNPYVLSLHPSKSCVEVHAAHDQRLVQTLSVPAECTFLWTPDDEISQAFPLVGSKEAMYMLRPITLDEQIRELLAQGCATEAITLYKKSVSDTNPVYQTCLFAVREEAAFVLLRQMRVKDAFYQFERAASLDPRVVISLFPSLKAAVDAFSAPTRNPVEGLVPMASRGRMNIDDDSRGGGGSLKGRADHAAMHMIISVANIFFGHLREQ
eukprot:TRINITY_DN2847_c0_g1_i1.p2 TRINITY_DN2847_c0_g1~~TRINITY_DN2847_c0_g1_i1.p2  ORF type:complete len:532 (-),score=153.53 TRINITY_DN2847_c0_g1_i1:1930-3525(-)